MATLAEQLFTATNTWCSILYTCLVGAHSKQQLVFAPLHLPSNCSQQTTIGAVHS